MSQVRGTAKCHLASGDGVCGVDMVFLAGNVQVCPDKPCCCVWFLTRVLMANRRDIV